MEVRYICTSMEYLGWVVITGCSGVCWVGFSFVFCESWWVG